MPADTKCTTGQSSSTNCSWPNCACEDPTKNKNCGNSTCSCGANCSCKAGECKC